MIQLRDYQERISTEAAAKLGEYGCCYLSMECRTGKSLTALSAAERYGAKSVLFITKLKAIASVKNDYKTLRNQTVPYEIEIVNYESCHKVVGRYDLVILDEAHSLGAYPKPSKRTKAVKELCKGLPVLFLSGTPSPESYSQLYHQFWVCDSSPWKDYRTFYKWAKAGYVNVRPKRVNGFNINDYSATNKTMIDADTKHLFISYSQEDAGFTANIIEQTLTVGMKPSTKVFIKKLGYDKVVYINGEAILDDSPAKLLSKLHNYHRGR